MSPQCWAVYAIYYKLPSAHGVIRLSVSSSAVFLFFKTLLNTVCCYTVPLLRGGKKMLHEVHKVLIRIPNPDSELGFFETNINQKLVQMGGKCLVFCSQESIFPNSFMPPLLSQIQHKSIANLGSVR